MPERRERGKESAAVGGSAQVHDVGFEDCVTTWRKTCSVPSAKFPATVPSVFPSCTSRHIISISSFYDRQVAPGAYLETRAAHMERWH